MEIGSYFMKVWLVWALPDNPLTCQSSCHEFWPFLIWQFMLIYHTQFWGVFFSHVTSQCQPLPTVPIFYGKKPWERGWFILRGHPRGNSKGQLNAKSIRFFEDQVIGNEFLCISGKTIIVQIQVKSFCLKKCTLNPWGRGGGGTPLYATHVPLDRV